MSNHILIVDDDPAILRTLSAGLRSRGYSVETAANGEEALRLADRRTVPIDLVISDLVMPEMNGVQLFVRLGQWFPEARFLFISGYVENPDAHLADGTRTAFLPKPFTLSQLVGAGRSLLDQTRRRVTQPRMRVFAAR